MQQFKKFYSDTEYMNTFSNIQRCLRLTDLDEIGDDIHYLIFDMIGLYSFRQWSLQKTVNFFIKFLDELGLNPDYVTIHPDKIEEWHYLYKDYGFEIREDADCLWSDGRIGGYSTEFYIDDIEIGNIVNTLGDCIDVGFGLERLLMVSNSIENKSKLQILEETSMNMINSGFKVGDYKESYILKKLIILSIKEGSLINHELFDDQRQKIIGNYKNYLRTKSKPKFKNKESSYWQNTFGIDENNLEFYENLLLNIN